MRLQEQKSISKSVYLGNELLGVEKRISPTLVNNKRASQMRNLLLADGAIKKRNGWRQIYHYKDENDISLTINGIFEYKDTVIIHAGGYLFSGDKKIGELSNKKSCGFENNGLLYIVCGGELYIYDGVALSNAYNSKYAYIPITTKRIYPIGYESIEEKNEAKSLLTACRTNTLIGDKSDRKKYRLDGCVDLSKPIEIKTKMLIKLDSQAENYVPYNAIYNDATRLTENNIDGVLGASNDVIYDVFNGKGTSYNLGVIQEIAIFLRKPIKIESAVFEAREGFSVPRMSFALGSDIAYDTANKSTGDKLDLTDTLSGQVIDNIYLYGATNAVINKINIQAREGYEGEIEIIHRIASSDYHQTIKPVSIKATDGREVSLSRNVKGTYYWSTPAWLEPDVSGNTILGIGFCNVSPTLTEDNIEITYSVKDAERLSCQIGEVCRADTGDAILVLADNSTIYSSCGIGGFGYFPVSLKSKLGTDEKITALCSMSDFTIGVFKASGVYYLEPKIKNGKTELILNGYSNQGGSLSHFGTKIVNLDTLSPTNECIFGSVGANGERVRRGDNIAKELYKHKLESSVAIEYDGSYFLFVDGSAYVADTRYKSYDSNRLDSSFQYEWWYLDNVPASYVAKIKGQLYIGRQDGRVVTFYDGYCDILYEKIDTGSFLLEENQQGDTTLYLNEALLPDGFSNLLVSNAYKQVAIIDSCALANDKATLYLSREELFLDDGSLKIYPNMEIYLQRADNTLLLAKVISVDLELCSITVDSNENIDTCVGIFEKCVREPFTIKAEDKYFLLIDKFDRIARLVYDNSTILECEKRENVVAEYVSSALLNDGKRKTLYEISVDLLSDSEGLVELSYETDKHTGKGTYMVDRLFELDDLDFASSSFNSSLQKSYTLRCYQGCFDYIIIKLKHSENRCISLKNYMIIYKGA